MTATPDLPLSKGMKLIAAYREARLRQRSALRTNPRESLVPHGVGCCDARVGAGSAGVRRAEAEPVASTPEAGEAAAAFADLGGLATPDGGTESCKAADPAASAHGVKADGVGADGAAARDPPLSAIGFGPGMTLRLGQLGLRTAGDLARADAKALRAALGDISRLVDVEGWIADARRTMRG